MIFQKGAVSILVAILVVSGIAVFLTPSRGCKKRGEKESFSEVALETEPISSKEIHDWYDLNDIRNDRYSNYTLMNDLDKNTDGYAELVDTEKGWDPIGGFGDSFSGKFDGNGHVISDLYIDRSEENFVGLFGMIVKSILKALE